MATPTLTSINPEFGHPGGKELITIEGTGFALPPAPPGAGYVGGDWIETVEIEIDGRLATDVRVWSDTKITCVTPAYRGDPAVLSATPGLTVDVKIRNIGPPIEEDTFTDAFAYKRNDLSRTSGVLQFVVRSLIRELRRQIIDYVVVGVYIDFDKDTGDALDIVEIAQVPAIALFGPDIIEDRFRRSSEKESVQDLIEYEYTKKRFPRTSILRWTATLTARGHMGVLNLVNEFTNFFARNSLLTIDKNSADPSEGVVEFDMYLTDGPTRVGSANDAEIISYSATFEIHGIPICADEGVEIEWGKITEEEAELTYERNE